MTQISSESKQPSLKGYITGFGLSLLLTLTVFLFVNDHVSSHHSAFSHQFLIILLAALAFIQFVVQMVFFLHLGTERRPRWKQLMFWFMTVVVLILVSGSIWIMQNLNYNMMHMAPEETRVYMKDNEGF